MKMEKKQQRLQRKRNRMQQKLQRRLQRKIKWKLKRKVKLPIAIFVGILFLSCFYTEITNASSGNITVKLSENVNTGILYLKVATMFNGEWRLDEEFKNCQVDLNKVDSGRQLTEVAGKLELYAHENQIKLSESNKKDLDNHVCLEQLEEGLYLVVMEENDSVIMSPTLVSLPGWTGEEMTYDVVVVPKITEKHIAPKTGWNSSEGLYALSMGIAILALMCIRSGRKPNNRTL